MSGWGTTWTEKPPSAPGEPDKAFDLRGLGFLPGTAYRFSIVVPTHNRPGRLRVCLRAMTRLDSPKESFEVIVVDDGSPQPVFPLASAFQDRLQIRVIRTENRGPAHARNVGVSAARGDWVAFTDDDCIVDPSWLRQLDRALTDRPDCLWGGRTVPPPEVNTFTETSQLILDMAYGFYNSDPRDARFFASNNMAVDRLRLEEAAGFDPRFSIASEDRDLCDRWRFRGGKLAYCSQAVVRHDHRLTLAGFIHQHFRYGRGARQYQKARMHRRSGSFASDMAFHLQLPGRVRAQLKRRPPGRSAAVCALLGVWQIANLTGYLYESAAGPKGRRVDDPR